MAPNNRTRKAGIESAERGARGFPGSLLVEVRVGGLDFYKR